MVSLVINGRIRRMRRRALTRAAKTSSPGRLGRAGCGEAHAQVVGRGTRRWGRSTRPQPREGLADGAAGGGEAEGRGEGQAPEQAVGLALKGGGVTVGVGHADADGANGGGSDDADEGAHCGVGDVLGPGAGRQRLVLVVALADGGREYELFEDGARREHDTFKSSSKQHQTILRRVTWTSTTGEQSLIRSVQQPVP